eukprot:101023-Hanusia_phi.AAC.1
MVQTPSPSSTQFLPPSSLPLLPPPLPAHCDRSVPGYDFTAARPASLPDGIPRNCSRFTPPLSPPPAPPPVAAAPGRLSPSMEATWLRFPIFWRAGERGGGGGGRRRKEKEEEEEEGGGGRKRMRLNERVLSPA